MKTDRILFGIACLSLGYLAHTSLNMDKQKDIIPEEISASMPKMKPELQADTISFAKCAEKDSLKFAEDSLKMIKKAIK
ncbi:MAG: hypothetical protein NC200_03160 [Candidatus Gastranaerophilales bacterium]|nr:hypothetical protein [Candidatus Gastranaerophilales bacterium]